MANPEKKFGEKFGETVRNGGIIAGVIGLILSPELLVLGFALAASGEIYRRNSKQEKGKQAA